MQPELPSGAVIPPTQRAAFGWRYLAGLLLAALLFYVDIKFPRGVTIAIGYCAVLVFAVTAYPPRHAILLAVFCSVLTLLALLLKPVPLVWPGWPGYINRLLTIGVIWLTVALGLLRRKADLQREDTRGRLQSIVDTAVDAIITIDERGTMETFNQAAERMFGFTASEMVGRNVNLLMPEPYHGEHDAYIGNYVTTGNRRIIGIGREVIGKRKDGSTFPLDLAVSETRLKGRRVFTGILHDITLRKQNEERLRRTVEELARSNAELEQFAFAISHDLRTPLTTIGGFLHILVQNCTESNQEATEAAAFVLQAVRHMDRLLQSLLQYARVGRGKPNFVVCSTDALVDRILGHLRASIEKSGAQITRDPLPTVTCDEVLIAQLLQNLIENAIKYRGETQPRIHISAERTLSEWVFSVRDNGIGIPGNFHGQIFEPFHRLHSDESRYEGVGIGLAISRKIVLQHRGRLWVQSKPDEGSTFFFSIPHDLANEIAVKAPAGS